MILGHPHPNNLTFLGKTLPESDDLGIFNEDCICLLGSFGILEEEDAELFVVDSGRRAKVEYFPHFFVERKAQVHLQE